MKIKEKKQVYTTAEVADLLRVSTRTINRLLQGQDPESEILLLNRFRAFRVGGSWRYEEITPKEQV